MTDLKLVVWDRGWCGATIVASTDPKKTIEEWRKAEWEYAAAQNFDHENGKYPVNPWKQEMERCEDYETFTYYNDIYIVEITEDLKIETKGDC